jgi:hypothetical protein
LIKFKQYQSDDTNIAPLQPSLFSLLLLTFTTAFSFGQVQPQVIVPPFDDNFSKSVQQLEDGQMNVKLDGKKKTFYFETSKVFEGYKKLGF